jgi:hypothetical protein
MLLKLSRLALLVIMQTTATACHAESDVLRVGLGMSVRDYNQQPIVRDNRAELSDTGYQLSTLRTPSRIIILLNGRELAFERTGSAGFVNVDNLGYANGKRDFGQITELHVDLAESETAAAAVQRAAEICDAGTRSGLNLKHPSGTHFGWVEHASGYKPGSDIASPQSAETILDRAAGARSIIHLCRQEQGETEYWVDIIKLTDTTGTRFLVTLNLLQRAKLA